MTGGYSDNQPDYSWIQPGETRTVVHYWYPVRELGGVKAANLEGALNLEVKDGKARLAVNTTTPRRDARVRLLAGRPGRLRDDGHDRPRRALRARGRTARRHPGGGPAPRRPRGGRDGAGGVRGPPATEDRRAEALRAASAARPGEDRGGAVPRGPAPRAVPQPALRPGGLLPRGAAPRPRRRPHEHGPRRPRPAPGPLRRGREAPHGRGRAPDREPHPREERRGAVRPGPRPRGPREDGRRARGLRRRRLGPRPTPAPPRSRRRGSSRRAATPPAPSTSSTARSAPTRATPPPCR